MIVTPDNWHSVVSQICFPADPLDYNEVSIRRMVELLGNRYYRMPKIPSAFKSYNRVRLIEFASEEDRICYNQAFNRYMAECARIDEYHHPVIRKLVEDGKLREEAERLKTVIIAQEAYNEVAEGYASVIGLCFKRSVVEVVNNLVHKHGVNPSKIAIIWGGYGAQERKRKVAEEQIRKKLSEEEVNQFIEDGLLDELIDSYSNRLNQDLSAIDKSLLGAVDKETRWKQIRAFQAGQADYAIFTLASGGVALSLHDEDGLRPRRSKLGLPYSSKMVVQAYGRAHRLTSCSDTYQESLAFNGTREVKVAKKVSQKLRCDRHTSTETYSDMVWTNDSLVINDPYIEKVNPEDYVTGDTSDES